MPKSTLYEAVALGLASIQGHDWAAEIGEDQTAVEVSSTEVSIPYSLKIGDFNEWLNSTGGNRKELADRNRIRGILGLPDRAQSNSPTAKSLPEKQLSLPSCRIDPTRIGIESGTLAGVIGASTPSQLRQWRFTLRPCSDAIRYQLQMCS